LTHGGGRDAECRGHFLALFANIAVGALVLLVVSTTGTAASGSAAWIMADQDRVFAKCAWRLTRISHTGLVHRGLDSEKIVLR
jgi:hypothetical protein